MSKVKQAIEPRSERLESPRPAHSPTPWQAFKHVQNLVEIGFDGGCIATVARFSWGAAGDSAENDANAEFIVRAVNVHDALVAALIKARLIIREWQGMGMEAEGDAWAIYDRNAPEMKEINAVLALASDTQEAKEDKDDEG